VAGREAKIVYFAVILERGWLATHRAASAFIPVRVGGIVPDIEVGVFVHRCIEHHADIEVNTFPIVILG
jgi:hypothetical protein